MCVHICALSMTDDNVMMMREMMGNVECGITSFIFRMSLLLLLLLFCCIISSVFIPHEDYHPHTTAHTTRIIIQ